MRLQHKLEISDACKEKYQEIIDCGARLSGESLPSGAVSQIIEHDDFDYASCLSSERGINASVEALEKMILEFDKETFMAQLKEEQAFCDKPPFNVEMNDL